MVNLYIKGIFIVVIVIAAVHTLRFLYSTSYYFTSQGSLEAFKSGAWSCEMNKRLVLHLRSELRDRDKLLKYRGKVIDKLRKTIVELNGTSSNHERKVRRNGTVSKVLGVKVNDEMIGKGAAKQGKLGSAPAKQHNKSPVKPNQKISDDIFGDTVVKQDQVSRKKRSQNIVGDIEEEITAKQDKKSSERRSPRQDKTSSSKGDLSDESLTEKMEPTPFPDDIDRVAGSGKRPCCMALKRMTDILRKYMDLTINLKHKVAVYEKVNITEKLIKYGEIVKKRTIAKNCSTQFIPMSVEKEKDGLYLSTDLMSVYEAVPLYLKPKQRLGNFGAKHRNTELKTAFAWALSELQRKTKQTADLLTNFDVIFKTDALKGNQYHFSIQSQTGKLYSVQVLRPLGPYMLDGKILDVSTRKNELINIIVPLSKRVDRLEQFLKMFQTNCVEQQEYVFLTFVLYGSATSTRELKLRINKFSKDTGFTRIDVIQRDLPFSRGRALDDGVRRWNGNPNVLMFFCDVDVTFDRKFLRRCRMYTEPQRKVYYPILFSLYNPSISGADQSEQEINAETGTWRPLGFGMMCAHRADYSSVGGFNLTIQGWGGEDNDLFTRFTKSSLKIIRAPDPGLFHKWHPKHCDQALGKIKYNHCLGAKARYEGSQRQLGLLLFKENTTAT